nr:MaoC/PaaZ C-terminal domain-containing protein [uncultured Desulfobacter sp.]
MPLNTVFLPAGRDRVVVMDTPLPIPKVFMKLISLSMVRPTTLAKDAVLKKICMVYPGVAIDIDRVNRFKQVCGYDTNRSGVPAAYIQSLFISIMSRFISSSYFPISPMGLIQTGQSFELTQAVSPGLKLDLYCRILDMTRTEKGIVSRFLMEAAVAGDHAEKKAFAQSDEKELVWHGIATYLTRSNARKPKGKNQPSRDIHLPAKEIIDVSANTGRRYAAVSRDFNPHHLYTWTALPMGFKQPIAHGIWSMARAGASLEKAAGYPALTGMDGNLKLPIFMPARITLGYTFSGTNARFELRDKAQGVPHLKGSFRFSPTKI